MVKLTSTSKAKDDQFTGFLEQELYLGRNSGWEKEIKAREQLAWEIHEQFPPTGSILLGHLILEQKTSYLKRDIGTKEFARSLVKESFQAVQQMDQKDGWDFYCLGLCHVWGRGASQDFSLAEKAFWNSSYLGNPYASFEAIWARYLAGGSRLEAVLAFTALTGKLADFAAYSARALALLEMGPSRVPGSPSHIARLLLLGRALREFINHTHGARQINIAIEKELRDGVKELRDLNTPRACLALYLTERTSRSNPTGKPPLDWFRDAIDPQLAELQTLCKCHDLGVEELQMIVERAEAEGWSESSLAKLAESELKDRDE